jgi:hypothetical protein
LPVQTAANLRALIRLNLAGGAQGCGDGMMRVRMEYAAMTDVPEKTIEAAQAVAETLTKRGHTKHAGLVRAALERGQPMRTALRDACQVVLTAIEAVDPVCATMVEELRLEVDARLTEKRGSA